MTCGQTSRMGLDKRESRCILSSKHILSGAVLCRYLPRFKTQKIMTSKFTTVSAAARTLGYSDSAIRKWLQQNKINGVRSGHSLRIPKSELERIVAEGIVVPR
jgi:excisionase family DNA binding protein